MTRGSDEPRPFVVRSLAIKADATCAKSCTPRRPLESKTSPHPPHTYVSDAPVRIQVRQQGPVITCHTTRLLRKPLAFSATHHLKSFCKTSMPSTAAITRPTSTLGPILNCLAPPSISESAMRRVSSSTTLSRPELN